MVQRFLGQSGVFAAAFCLMAVAVAGCTPNEQIRTEKEACLRSRPSDTEASCGGAMVEERAWPVADVKGQPVQVGYTLAFVEFDDQGKEFDPRQQKELFDRMAAEKQPLSIIVFVHGWKHNAGTKDDNVQDFRKLLSAIALSEAQKAPADRRKVVGVYAGWRGLSATVPVLYNLSFWERKATAQRVAEGGIRGLLGKLRAFRDTQAARKDSQGQSGAARGTRMLTIGHSFGGAVVYSALAQYFIDRAAIATIHGRYFPGAAALDHADEKPDPREISSYGDLVVLVNPAIEAMRYDALRQLVVEQRGDAMSGSHYAPCQSPVLVQVTSEGDNLLEGDWATGVVFPLGRMVDTPFEQTRIDAAGENERDQIQMSMGHYRQYWTHELRRAGAEPTKAERSSQAQTQTQTGAQAEALVLSVDRAADDRSFRDFEATSRVDGYLRPNWSRQYRSGAVLTDISGGRFDPNNPFWMVRAYPNIILDHNDISAPVFVNFVHQLYDDIDRLKTAPECEAARRRTRPPS